MDRKTFYMIDTDWPMSPEILIRIICFLSGLLAASLAYMVVSVKASAEDRDEKKNEQACKAWEKHSKIG